MVKTRSRSENVPLLNMATGGNRKVKKETPHRGLEKTESSFLKREVGTKKEQHSRTVLKPTQVDDGRSDKVEEDASDTKHNLEKKEVIKSDWYTDDLPSASSTQKSSKRPLSPSSPHSPQKTKYLKEEEEDQESAESEDEFSYENLREKNMKDNEAFFASLGILKAKEQLKLTSKKSPKVFKRREPKKVKVALRRKSLRIQRIDPTGLPLPSPPEPEFIEDKHPRIPSGPVKMTDTINNEEDDHDKFVRSLRSLSTESCRHKPLSEDLSRVVTSMKKMHISSKAKVCKNRLFSVAIHPTCDQVLTLAGDKWGQLGFWKVDCEDEDSCLVTYKPHSRPIGHIVIPPADPLKVFTCSYDSTLRCGDIEKGVFEELYSVPEEEDDLFRSFDFISPTSLIMAQFRGDVVILDSRTPGQKAEKVCTACDKYLRTISVHPTNTNIFITAGTDVKVWDMRKMTAKGLQPLHRLHHGRAVSSAYFSPVTGNNIVSCSADDTLNIFSCSSSCAEVTRTKSISHNNKTGRWLTPFRAAWHPTRDDVFFVGSMKTPRRIEAFGLDGRLLHEFQGDVLSSICSVVQFHPSQNILVGGNSSGYIFPFM